MLNLKYSFIDTPLGEMIALSNENDLYLLAFKDQKGLEKKLSRVTISEGLTKPIISIKNELKDYFLGNLKNFTTSYFQVGTPFQKLVWQKLALIKYGQTRSYQEQAEAIGNSLAIRAVANANAKNNFAIIVPCHRIIRSNGELGGYAGGIERKEWLLQHEGKKYMKFWQVDSFTDRQ